MKLTSEQMDVLLAAIKPHRVKILDGNSHVEGYDVRAMLIRVFGFGGFDEVSVEPPVLLYDLETETKNGKPAHKVAYRAHRRLVIRDAEGNEATYEASAVGESIMPDFKRGDGHDMAVKTAETQALKRCVTNLGDQFGLSLYNGGSLNALVKKVVGYNTPELKEATE